MAEVKQTSGSFSLPLKNKPPSFNNNGVSSSFKHTYDNDFDSLTASKVKSSSTFLEDDYAEIFGSSKSNNGSWSIPYSSVPLLELPRNNGLSCRGERVDYGGVFGGFDNGGGFGLPDGEELFDQLKKKAKTSSLNNFPRSQGQSIETTGLESPSQPYDEQLPTNGFSQSFDNMKHLESENGKVAAKATRTRKAAHVRVYSFHGPVIKDDSPDTDSNLGGKQGTHYRHTSLDLGAQSSNTDASLRKVSSMSVSNLVDTSYGTSQTNNPVTNGFYQSSDNTMHSEYKMNMSIRRNDGETHTPEVHPIHKSMHSLHELGPTHFVQPIHESNNSLNELDSTQETMSNKTSVLNEPQGPQSTNDVNVVEEHKRHSRNTSLDLGSKLNDNCDGVFQKPCGVTESTSIDNSHVSCEASCVVGTSNMMKDDVFVDCGKVKKKGRCSRMASIDLGDYKHSSEHEDGLKRKPRLGGSYSFDASHDPCASRVKVHPSMMYPSSSLPRFFPVERRYKISENSSGKCWDGSAGDSPPSLVEELDVNSDAAISAAILRRAIEEAELRIRMAKAFLEREGQESTNLRFKDTLKVRAARENGVVNEVHKFKQTKMREWCPPVVDSERKEPYFPLDKKHDAVTDQRGPFFEDQKKFVKEEKLASGEDAKVSNLITGDDKHEGEWEAAKHFNQLISGVKNKLASFISWRTETEKKEVVKEMEATMKAQNHPEEIEHDFKDRETSKRKRTEQNVVTSNVVTSSSSCEAMHGQNKLQFVSEAVEPEENEVVRSFKLKQDRAENRVDSTPNATTRSLTNFQFFAFRNQKVCNFSDPEVKEREPLETRESEMVNGQEQEIVEVEIECIHFEGEEASQEESDDKCVIQDSKRQNDTPRTSDVCLQNDEIVEDLRPLAGHNIKDLSVGEVCQGNMIWKDDLCSISRENVEMVEEHYSMAGHDEKDPAHDKDEQDYMSGKRYLGSVNEENDELVELPSFAGHDEMGLPHEEDRQGDMYRFSHIGSSNEENGEMKEVCTQAGHERKDVMHEVYNSSSSTEEFGDESMDNSHHCGNTSERTDEDNVGEVQEEANSQHVNVELLKETWRNFEFSEVEYECQENGRNRRETNHFEEVPGQTYEWEDIKQFKKQTELIEEITEKVNVQASCIASADEGCIQNDNVFSSKADDACTIDAPSSKVEEAVYCIEELERMMDMTNTSGDPETDVQSPVTTQKARGLLEDEFQPSAQKSSDLIGEEPPESPQKPVELIAEERVLSSLSTEIMMKLDRNEIKEGLNGTIGTLDHENIVSLDSELDFSSEKKDVDVKAVDPEYQYKLDNQTHYLHEAGENQNLGEFDTASDLDAGRSGFEAFHTRRRWFDHGGTIAAAERPSILEGTGIELEIRQEVLSVSELAGSLEIHTDKLNNNAADCATVRDADASKPDIVKTNVETTPTRRKWFVNEGKPEPVSLFEDINVNLEVPLESMDESLPNISGNYLDKLNAKSGESLNAVKSDVAVDGGKGKESGEAAPRRKRWFESGERVGTSQQVKLNADVGLSVEIDQVFKAMVDEEQLGKLDSMSIPQEKNDVTKKEKPEKESHKVLDEVNRRGKERIAVERAIREARERAFAEAKERARREAADRPNLAAHPKAAAGIQEKLGKVSSSDKASVEAKLKAERVVVERATTEARERALQKALSEKASHRSREQAGKCSSEKNSSLESKYQSSRGSDSLNNKEKAEGAYVESAQRRKARLESQTRTMERAAKALEEKNRHDLLAQKEQTAKNMIADSLDAEVKRWCTGKDGNLCALLSTLQYVLGPDSGWQPVSLTDLVAPTAVRKAYKKANLCVHPDKLQQRGATIQQKYICEKVFDLLKDAWSKFNLDERY